MQILGRGVAGLRSLSIDSLPKCKLILQGRAIFSGNNHTEMFKLITVRSVNILSQDKDINRKSVLLILQSSTRK